MAQELYILDLMGTFAFALYGAYFALKERFDIFGIFLCAFLTAVGGGTIREMILDSTPAYFSDTNYVLTIAVGTLLAIFLFEKFHRIRRFALILDALGLAVFAFIGASRAHESHFGIFATALLAMVTAVGGGVLRDVIMNKVPEIMKRDFYASAAILEGIIYGMFPESMNHILWANLLLVACFAMRLLAIFFQIDIWSPRGRVREKTR